MAVDQRALDTVVIGSDADIVEARRRLRSLADGRGFSEVDLAMTATAVSELARNILTYSSGGEILVVLHTEGAREAVRVVARDQGPGIADIELAMQDGYSTSGGLGLGLPGSRRLVDDFELESAVGVGTTVTLTKWISRR